MSSMAATATTQAPTVSSPETDAVPSEQSATAAATRVARAGALLGVLGLASSLFVVARLVETWRVTPESTSHRISLLGVRLGYPAANLGALVVLVLAGVGLAVMAIAIAAAVRECAAARRLGRRIDASELELLDDALIIPDDRPLAFCAGLLRPRVCVSSGAVALLDQPALRAVLLHERHHARRRDPLRLAAGSVIARALFFVPGLAELMRQHQALAELSADENAIGEEPANRSALARAMLSFTEASSEDDRIGIDPTRVDRLLGEPPSWRFPLLLSLVAVGVIALVVAIGVLAGQVASGSATLAPPFLSSQPCVVVLSLLPALVVLVVVRLRRTAGVR